MYDKLRREFYWPKMAADTKRIVSEHQSCAQNNPTYRHKRNLQLFPVAGPPEFIAVDILGLFPETKQCNTSSTSRIAIPN